MGQAVELKWVKCQRCGYEWPPRTPYVRSCANPGCRSVAWNKPRKKKPEEVKPPLSPGKPDE
jgi:hypothetical protein